MSEPKEIDFWRTPEGITQRVNNIAQVFSYRVVNNALRIIGKTNGAKWMEWILHPERSESGPCVICIGYSRGGRNGAYRVHWFLPRMPVHPFCVCEWEIWFEKPTFGQDEVDRAVLVLEANKRACAHGDHH